MTSPADEQESGAEAETSSSSQLDDLLGEAFRAPTRPSPPPLVLPMADRFGPYDLVESIGRGGMGQVFLAEQEEPVRRRVALKVIRTGVDSRQLVARFGIERQALARLNHDNVARVLDSGASAAGQPFVVMEYVAGLPFIAHCDRYRLDLEARLLLFATVCDGVQHAHQHGVLHRDLKPSNILVTRQNGRDVAKIIDFGLARAIDASLGDNSVHTRLGAVLGTPDFMSPEQASGSQDVDTRTDVYSLGVLLYETLSGGRPIDKLEDAGLAEVQRRILHEEPVLPSVRLASSRARDAIAAARATDARRLVARLRGDLDWVTRKALEKDRERRHASAAELAADMRAYLRHDPVSAGPPGVGYRLGKLARRHRGKLAAAGTVLSLLIGWIATNTALSAKARGSADAEREARQDADKQLALFNQLAGVARLQAAKEALAPIFPALPQNVAALQTWLDKEQDLVRTLPTQLRVTIDSLRRKHLVDSNTTALDVHLADAADQFLHDALATLLVDIAAFEEREYAAAADDLAWARTVQARSVDQNARAWSEARAAALSAAVYHDAAGAPLDLQPQIGLVPLGADPDSGLLEFYDLRSAANPAQLPTRDASGRLRMLPDMGVVFVLVPGGTCRLGDGGKSTGDASVPSVEIAPFFLSKYELTQAQWKRLTRGGVPSLRPPDDEAGRDLSNPVDNVSFAACTALFARQGWEIPNETQWVYACRARTETPWSTGPAKESLAGHVNCSDRKAHAANPAWTYEPWLDDGFALSAPVGRFAPNAFGLHDMHGNVSEWCANSRPALAPGTATPPVEMAVCRGGSYVDLAEAMRSAAWGRSPVDHSSSSIGVRPLRSLASK